jgi:hypothetical protein
MVVPTLGGRTLALKNLLNNTAPQNMSLRLFTNNVTPTVTSVAGDFTEAAGGGYAAKTLAGGSWTFGNDGVDDGLATYADQTWTFTGALTGSATIYGWFMVQVTSGIIVAAERLSDTMTPAVANDALTLSPAIRAGDLG